MKVHRTNNVIAHLVDIVVADIQKRAASWWQPSNKAANEMLITSKGREPSFFSY